MLSPGGFWECRMRDCRTVRSSGSGANGSVAVEISGAKRGQWFDHEGDIGGGPLDLLRVKGGVATGEAVNWLRDELGIEPEPTKNRKARIVATYDYCDERGELLFQVCRNEQKEFPQRRPDGAWGINGIRKVVY